MILSKLIYLFFLVHPLEALLAVQCPRWACQLTLKSASLRLVFSFFLFFFCHENAFMSAMIA